MEANNPQNDPPIILTPPGLLRVIYGIITFGITTLGTSRDEDLCVKSVKRITNPYYE